MYHRFPFYKLPVYYLNKRFNFGNLLPLNVVFVITSRCNSRCATCFIWKHQGNIKDELRVDEYVKILKTMKKVFWVTIGGGEPFLREDFLEIVLNICNYLKPKIVNIPSNGSMPEKIFYAISKLVYKYPGTQFLLNLSIDHISERHDQIRGMHDNFRTICNTIERLRHIKNTNFSVGVHTVISKYNIIDFPYIHNFVMENIKPDSYIIENAQARAEFMNSDISLLHNESDYIGIIDYFVNRLKNHAPTGIGKLKRAFRLVYYDSVRKSLISKKKPYTCYAGHISCQISPDGSVWACATKKFSLGELRENNYDFQKLWFSCLANQTRNEIRKLDCYCYLSNVAYTNILLHPSKVFSILINCIKRSMHNEK
jgi:MoaA/NifB/PqqE/SkfB family radical SAM enzyme